MKVKFEFNVYTAQQNKSYKLIPFFFLLPEMKIKNEILRTRL